MRIPEGRKKKIPATLKILAQRVEFSSIKEARNRALCMKEFYKEEGYPLFKYEIEVDRS